MPQYQYSKKIELLLFRNIIQPLKKLISVVKVKAIIAIATFVITLFPIIQTILRNNADLTISIWDIELQDGQDIEIYYCIPLHLFHNNKPYGYLPITIINKKAYDIQNCEIWINTSPFIQKEPIYTYKNGIIYKSEKDNIIGSRFIASQHDSLENNDIKKSYTIYELSHQERISYKTTNFTAKKVERHIEKFKIDTNRMHIDGYSCPTKDFFNIEINYIKGNNKQVFSSKCGFRILEYIDINQIIDKYQNNGLIGDIFTESITGKPPKRKSCIVIYPELYKQENGNWAISFDEVTKYVLEYDTPYHSNIKKRKIRVYDKDNKIVIKKKFKVPRQ